MKLYLVRHADPKPEEMDPERSLSDVGEWQADVIGRFVKDAEVEVAQVRHSGKKRAQQTAEIIGIYLEPPKGIVEMPGIAPADDVSSIAEMLADEEEDLMLVGHLPFMNRLAGLLVSGDPDCAPVDFPKAGTACLVREGDSWTIDWLMHPGLFP